MSTDADGTGGIEGTVGTGSRPRSASGRKGRAGGKGEGAGPALYDFRRPTKLSREHVRTLQIVFETFARQWATLLTSTLRAVGQVGLISIEQLTYDEYIRTLANPTVVHLLSLEPLAGTGVLEFSMSTAMISVDHLLGGPGSPNQPERHLTDIESSLLGGLVTRVLSELRYSFDTVVRMEPQVTAVEYNPQFAQAASPADVMVVASFDLRIGVNESVATLCLPFAGLHPMLEASLGHGQTTERERLARMAARESLEAGLEAVPVEVTVSFQPTTVTPRTLVGLRVGDVLPLQHPVAAPLRVCAADVIFAHAVPGAQGRRLAGLVVEDPPDADRGSTHRQLTRRYGA